MECANPNVFGKKSNHFYGNWRFVAHNNPEILRYSTLRPCGNCVHCRKERGRENALCCVLEAQQYQHNHFITLTKRPDYEKENPGFSLKEIGNFRLSLRRWCRKENNVTPKIFRVHEHGKLGRSHYHIIAFNLQLHDLVASPRPDTNTSEKIDQLWKHGFTTVQDVTMASAMYQSLYLDKDLKNGNANSEKKAKSYHSGIGLTAFQSNYKQWLRLGYIPYGEEKFKIPRKFLKHAQKHLDMFNLTNHDFCMKYSKEHTEKIMNSLKPERLCSINLEPNEDLANDYIYFKSQERSEEKNDEKIKQIFQYLETEKLPDFYISGENAIYNEANRLQKDKL